MYLYIWAFPHTPQVLEEMFPVMSGRTPYTCLAPRSPGCVQMSSIRGPCLPDGLLAWPYQQLGGASRHCIDHHSPTPPLAALAATLPCSRPPTGMR
jgi:hypothetical protein